MSIDFSFPFIISFVIYYLFWFYLFLSIISYFLYFCERHLFLKFLFSQLSNFVFVFKEEVTVFAELSEPDSNGTENAEATTVFFEDREGYIVASTSSSVEPDEEAEQVVLEDRTQKMSTGKTAETSSEAPRRRAVCESEV